MAFLTDAQVKNALAGLLHSSPKDVPEVWNEIIASSHTAGYKGAFRILRNRGYTAAQIATWDDGAEFERDISLYWCLVKGAGLHSFDDTFISKLDRRTELEDAPILIGDDLPDPADASSEPVSYGAMSTTNERFSQDPDDANLGEPTEW